MRTRIIALLAMLAVPAWADVDLPRDIARLQGLDKQTARVSTFDVVVGETIAFGSLMITPRACYEAPPTESPESAVYLEIDDLPPQRRREEAFRGWMFASSPALSALEHVRFDVWVLDCLERVEVAPETAEPEPVLETGPPRRRPG